MPHRTTSHSEWRKVADLVADVAAVDSIHEMVAVAIERAHALFEADIVICDRFDEQARQIAFQMYPTPTQKFIDLTLHPFLAFWHQHPFQPEWSSEIGKGRISLLSDRVTHREFGRTDLWNEAYIHLRAKNQIMFGGEIEHHRYFCLSCNRLGRDYGSRDREVGRFIQKHLTRLMQRQARRDRANRAWDVLEQSSAAFLVINAQGETVELSHAAREILGHSGTPASQHPLLAELSRQQRTRTPAGTITTHAMDGLNACMLRPTTSGPAFIILGKPPHITSLPTRKLTSREAEIFHWVGQAKNNGEIGILLGISSRTVEKHCENLFSKLGVEHRLAAALLSRDAR